MANAPRSLMPPADSLFKGPGNMRARCRTFDWSATPLGAVSGWPTSLRTTVAMIMASKHPMFLECPWSRG